MEATQTDIEAPQSSDQVDGQVDSLAGGIMDLLDDPNPNASGEAVATKPAETPATEPEAEPEATPAEPAGEDEQDKYTIRWQGQDKEVTQAELLDLAQKGFDYTQKTQALAQERDNLAPIQGLATLLKSDPVKAAQIAAILTGQAPQQAQPEKKTFDDPIEQLAYDIEQRILAKTQEQVQQSITPLHRQAALNQAKAQVQADPDFKEVNKAIFGQIMSLPGAQELLPVLQQSVSSGQPPDFSRLRPSLARDTYLRLDQDPATYMEAFQLHKQRLQKPETPAPPKPVKKETRAPILESGGVEAPSGIEGKAKAERISKQKAKALREGSPTAIADWLKASGAIDHLY
jgi:hypothetical protein